MEEKPRPPIQDPWEYAREYFHSQSILDEHERYAKYIPEVFQGFMTLRQGVFMKPPHGALAPKYKELVCVAIECAGVIPAAGHARRAIDEGATPHEVAEVVSLCIMLGGMVTYMHSGRSALQAAEERAKELAGDAVQEKRVEERPRPPVRDPWEYAREYFHSQSILDEHERYAKYIPEVFQGFMTLRQGAFMEPPHGALTPKYKELICVAIECAGVASATGHARWAIDQGATPHEVAEVVSLCIMLRGMVTYMHSGRFALQAAEERAKELADTAGE